MNGFNNVREVNWLQVTELGRSQLMLGIGLVLLIAWLPAVNVATRAQILSLFICPSGSGTTDVREGRKSRYGPNPGTGHILWSIAVTKFGLTPL